MRILITTDWYEPVINGVVTSVLSLKKGLEQEGHEVRVLTLSGDLRSYQDGDVTYIGSVSVGMIYPNARIKMAMSHQYVKALVNWRPDVVHSQCEFSTFFLAKRIAALCRVPLVHTYHTVYEDYTHYFSPSKRWGKQLAAAFSRRIAAQTSAVVAPTQKVADMLRSYRIDQPIFTVPSGLELSRFSEPFTAEERKRLRSRFGVAETDTVLLYVGRLAKEKNVQELFYRLAADRRSDLRLLLVGDGPYREELTRLCHEMGLDERVIFAGMAAPEQIAAYYRAGDIFVSASQSETQGLTYIEAMACGLPVLCRADPCLKDVIVQGQNGFIYSSDEQFAAKLNMLLASPKERMQIGAEASRMIWSRYSYLKFAQDICGVYLSCIENESMRVCA